MTTNVLLVGRTAEVIDDARQRPDLTGVELLAGTSLDGSVALTDRTVAVRVAR